MGRSGKERWKISFHKSPSTLLLLGKQAEAQTEESSSIPKEFLCPISNSVMADPVIVSSGHTFERNCVDACVSLSFHPNLPGAADFTTVIPNLALKSAIVNWCHNNNVDPPEPISYNAAQKLMQTLMEAENHLSRTASEVSVRSSEESVTRLPFTTRPSCCSSSSSFDNEIFMNSCNLEEEEMVQKLKSSQISEQEESLASLRQLTRTREDKRHQFCTMRLLSAVKSLISSRYMSIQVNAVAALVNLSLEKENKVKIVRSGIVPPLIDVLRGGFPEAQEHAAGAIFSLALDEQNKTAIGVLGAIPPLLHAIRSASERTRHDSSLALYHISLVQSNRFKMIKLGCVPILLPMAKSRNLASRVMLILCNLAATMEGRAAMLDGGAVACFVSMIKENQFDSPSSLEGCVTAFYGLSYGGLRFKGLAKEAGAEAVFRKFQGTASDRANDKILKILEVLTEKEDDKDEDIDWEDLLTLKDLTKTQTQIPK